MPLNDSSGDNWGKIYAQSVNSVFKIVENKIAKFNFKIIFPNPILFPFLRVLFVFLDQEKY